MENLPIDNIPHERRVVTFNKLYEDLEGYGAPVVAKKGLSINNEKFVERYLAYGLDSEKAFREVFGGRAEGLSDKDVRKKANGLLKRMDVQVRINEICQELGVDTLIDKTYLARKIVELIESDGVSNELRLKALDIAGGMLPKVVGVAAVDDSAMSALMSIKDRRLKKENAPIAVDAVVVDVPKTVEQAKGGSTI